jgi:xanthine dehydrogenase YagS FAD-binding subunit
MQSFEWADATSVEDAIQLTIKGSAIKAGGMDVVDLMKEHLLTPTRLVNIRRIPGLDQITEDEKSIRIGPLVTLTQLSENPIVQKNAMALAQAAGHAATPQVRNMATIGGNILQRPRCWYFRNEQFPCRKKGGEICYAQEGENQYHAIFHNSLCAIVHPSAVATPLIALGGKIEITGAKDKREVAIEDFIAPPTVDVKRENTLKEGEIITQIIVPKSLAKSYYIKQGEKESFDWPVAECAVVMEMDGGNCKRASVVLGAAAPTPYRAKYAQDALAGKPVNADTARAAANGSMTGATPLHSNGYKVPLFKAIVARTILACAGGNGANGAAQ